MELDPLSQTEAFPKKSSPLHLGWLLQILFQPRQTFQGIVSEEKKKTWLTPIVAVSLLLIVAALISTFLTNSTSTSASQIGTRITQLAQTQATRSSGNNNNANRGGNQGNQPGGFQGAPPGALPGGDFGGGFVNPGGGTTTTTNGASSTTASSTNIWLSLLWPVVSFIITWLLLGGLTNLLSLAGGGKSNALMAINIAAWASVPIGVRNLMQIVYFLASGASIQSPGLSGFLSPASSDTLLIFAQFILARVDLYLFWQIALLAVGVAIWGGVSGKKALVIASVVVIIVVLLLSLVGLGVHLLGNVNLNTSSLLRLR